jgi:hypothetical protein
MRTLLVWLGRVCPGYPPGYGGCGRRKPRFSNVCNECWKHHPDNPDLL